MNENDMIHKIREAAERGDVKAAMELAESYIGRGGGEERGRGGEVVAQGRGSGTCGGAG